MYPKKMSLNCEQFFLNLIYSLYFHLKHPDDGVLQHYISESWSKMQNGQEEEVPCSWCYFSFYNKLRRQISDPQILI